MNANELAKIVTVKEGLKQSQSIAQVKEVISIVRKLVMAKTSIDIYALMAKVK